MPATEYDQQASQFLNKHGVTLRSAVHPQQKAPAWTDGNHGTRYRVTILRDGKRVSFDFWDSIHNREHGIPLSDYSVLACISGDAYCPEDFASFCGEYGYDEDSREAERTWRRCTKFAKQLRAFFSETELRDLSEIQ